MGEVHNFSELNLNQQYSFSDYLQWKFNERVELLRGWIRKMSPAPSLNHQRVSQNLNFKLFEHFQSESCNIFVAPFDVRLPISSKDKSSTVVQPDICIICDESKLDKYGCNGAPELVVEILSPGNSNFELNTKFALYEEAGVLEYWVISIETKAVFVYTLNNGKYIGLKPQTPGEIVESRLFPEMCIAVDDVFRKITT